MKGVELLWPGGEHRFLLTLDLLRALEQKCDAGPAWILARLGSQQWRVNDVTETLRLGLIGGGMDDGDARKLVDRTMAGRALTEFVLTAQGVLMAALYAGIDEDGDDGAGERQAAADD